MPAVQQLAAATAPEVLQRNMMKVLNPLRDIYEMTKSDPDPMAPFNAAKARLGKQMNDIALMLPYIHDSFRAPIEAKIKMMPLPGRGAVTITKNAPAGPTVVVSATPNGPLTHWKCPLCDILMPVSEKNCRLCEFIMPVAKQPIQAKVKQTPLPPPPPPPPQPQPESEAVKQIEYDDDLPTKQTMDAGDGWDSLADPQAPSQDDLIKEAEEFSASQE